MVLALLLVRQGVRVTVQEAREDFDRKFRGDTIHASVAGDFWANRAIRCLPEIAAFRQRMNGGDFGQ